MKYILSIDQGTTSTTVIIVDETLKICGSASKELTQHYPEAGYVEHQPDEIWQSVLDAIGGAIARARIDARHIEAIGITNQRETTVVWERKSGAPIYPAIVWQCRRTTEQCARLKRDNLEPLIREKTGLLCDPYFSATKVRWILEHTGRQRDAVEGKLCFGTIDSYLLWQMTGGLAHATDPSNASRTLLMNLETLDWDDDLLRIFDIPRAMLPHIGDNQTIFGLTRGVPGLSDGIPVASMIGDQQAALFGQCCFHEGDAKCTFGTGAFLLLNTGTRRVCSKNGLLTTCAWKRNGHPCYALEGSAFVAGALIQWLRDGLGIIQNAADIEALAASIPDEDGVVIVPALTGLGAPHWNPEARGMISGVTRSTGRAHIARAALMGICHQNTDLLEAMVGDLNASLKSLRVDGGASIDNLMMQMQADLLNTRLIRPENLQTTAMGAAMCAALVIQRYQSQEELERAWRIDRTFKPEKPQNWRDEKRSQWKKAIRMTCG